MVATWFARRSVKVVQGCLSSWSRQVDQPAVMELPELNELDASNELVALLKSVSTVNGHYLMGDELWVQMRGHLKKVWFALAFCFLFSN